MATHLITNSITTLALGLFDDALIAESGAVVDPGGYGIYTSGTSRSVTLSVFGPVFARDGAIAMNGTTAGTAVDTGYAGNSVFLGASAQVSSMTTSAVAFWGYGNTLGNAGLVQADRNAVSFHGNEVVLSNSGRLESTTDTAVAIYPATGGGARTTDIFNSGTIQGRAGIESTGQGTTMTIENTGAIVATGAQAISHTATGGYALSLLNTGTIQGQGVAVAVSSGSDDSVTNEGMISGDVVLEDGADVLRNAGLINGDVDLGAGADSYAGFGGRIIGSLDAGAGDDTLRIDDVDAIVDGGADFDTVYLKSDFRGGSNLELVQMWGSGGHTLADDDTATQLNGNIGNNVIMGNGGNDTIRGGQGLDELSGGDGDDLIIGNSGDDEIDGGNGADQIFGGRGADEIFGGYGQDTIAGGAGDDTISGGAAQDILSGGYGNDVFLFESAADAGSGSNADRIDNFARGEDVIDLVGLGTTPASFIGTSGFSAGGNMEVRYTVNAFGNALVRIDENGDGSEDARVVVSQTATLDAGDFLL